MYEIQVRSKQTVIQLYLLINLHVVFLIQQWFIWSVKYVCVTVSQLSQFTALELQLLVLFHRQAKVQSFPVYYHVWQREKAMNLQNWKAGARNSLSLFPPERGLMITYQTSLIHLHVYGVNHERARRISRLWKLLILMPTCGGGCSWNDWPWVPLEEESGCSSVDSHSPCYSRSLSDLLEWCGFLVLTQTHASGLQWPEERGNKNMSTQMEKKKKKWRTNRIILSGWIWLFFCFLNGTKNWTIYDRNEPIMCSLTTSMAQML